MLFSGGPVFASLKLESSEVVNHNTKKLRFQLPDQDAASGLPLTGTLPRQVLISHYDVLTQVLGAVLTYSWPEGHWFPVVRPYTPINPSGRRLLHITVFTQRFLTNTVPDEPGILELMVKKYPGGKQSTHIHSLTPGQTLFFVAAIKGFAWTPNAFPHVTLIAGGAGITPIFQLVQGIMRNPADQTKVTLVLGVNGDQDILLRDEFERFTKEHPGRLDVTYTVSHPDVGSPHRKGYVTKELLEEVIPGTPADKTKVFVCGPPAMEEALVGKRGSGGILQQLGYTKGQIHRF